MNRRGFLGLLVSMLPVALIPTRLMATYTLRNGQHRLAAQELATKADPVPLLDINIKDISADERYWRAPLVSRCERLAESIKEIGLMSPIMVRRLPFSKKYAMVSGHHRMIACIILGHKTIKAYVSNMTEEQAVRYFMNDPNNTWRV